MYIKISEIKIAPGRREADPDIIRELANSISRVGLINPITIDQEYNLIAGLHRLGAVKQLGWLEIECTISTLEGLLAELAEVDENVVRKELSTVEYSDLLLRRKEIYEALHPETKAGLSQAAGMNRVIGKNVDCKMQTTSRSFVEDTAEKLGVHPCTIARQIQTAKNLTPEAKDIIRQSGTKVTKKEALKLSRLSPEQQKEAASQLAKGKIGSLEQYLSAPTAPKEPKKESKKKSEPLDDCSSKSISPGLPAKKRFVTFEENVADLKNPDKDCSCTPDGFLEEIGAYIRKFNHGIEWYTTPCYSDIFHELSKEQVQCLRQLMDSVCSTVNRIFAQIERGSSA